MANKPAQNARSDSPSAQAGLVHVLYRPNLLYECSIFTDISFIKIA